MDLKFTLEQLKELKLKYDEYKKEKVRLVSVLNYARDEYYKRYNKVKWNNYDKYHTQMAPEFKRGHYEDPELDLLYYQVLKAQENYQQYRKSNELFNSDEFQILMSETFPKIKPEYKPLFTK